MSSILHKTTGFGLALVLVTPLAFAQPVIKIGVLAPLTGGSASDGAWLMKGHELAIEQINARGGIRSLGGAKLQMVVGDTQSKPETARGEAERLAEREKVSAIAGAWASAVSAVVSQVAERSAVPFVITSAVADNLTEKNLQYTFRVSPKSKWAVDDVGQFLGFMEVRGTTVTKAAIIYEDGPYGQSVASNYKSMLASRKIPVVADESFRSGVSDLSTQVSKMRAAGADVVFMAAYVNDSVVLFRAMNAQSYKPMIFGYGQGHVQPSLLQIGKVVDGSFAVTEWMPDLKKDSVSQFVTSFNAKYKAMPLTSSAQAYVSTWTIAEALEKAKSTSPNAVREALAAVKAKTGPTTVLPSEELAFDADRQHKVGHVIVQVIDGKFVTVWPTAVAAGQIVPFK